MSFIAWMYYFEAAFGRSKSPTLSFERAIETAHKALELDENNPGAHSVLGAIYLSQRQYEKGIAENKKAIAKNPNYDSGYAHLSGIMHYYGKFEESITLYKKAYRLNPRLLPIFLRDYTRSYIFLGRYEEALDAIHLMEDHARSGNLPKNIPLLLYSFVYQELGKEEEARAYMAEAIKINPFLSLEFIKNNTLPYKNSAHLQRMLAAYRMAGMPEKALTAVQ